MALSAYTTITGLADSRLNFIPIAGMGINLQAAYRTVTFHTDVALRMTCLTGHQIFSGLTGMNVAPVVGRQQGFV